MILFSFQVLIWMLPLMFAVKCLHTNSFHDACLISFHFHPSFPFVISWVIFFTLISVSIRYMPWSQARLTHRMRVASSSSYSVVLLTTPSTLHGSSSSPPDTTLSVSTPTFTAMARSASASWGESGLISFQLCYFRWTPSKRIGHWEKTYKIVYSLQSSLFVLQDMDRSSMESSTEYLICPHLHSVSDDGKPLSQWTWIWTGSVCGLGSCQNFSLIT